MRDLTQLAVATISEKERIILSKLNGSASSISEKCGMPRSTFWFNIRKLRSKNILTFGDGKVILTSLGKRLLNKPEKSGLGIIGGFGPDTSTKFQLNLIKRFQKEFDRQPKTILINAPVTREAENLAVNGNPNKLKSVLLESIKTLCSANVFTIVLPCNTAHIFIQDLRANSDVPVISIIEESAKVTSEFSKIGILCTTSTVKSKMFEKELGSNRCIIPTAKEQKDLDSAINKILLNGKTTNQLDCFLNKIANSLIKRGAQAIILACTDLQFADFSKIKIPIIDTLQVLENVSFEKLRPAIAQLAERSAVDREVVGASLARGTGEV